MKRDFLISSRALLRVVAASLLDAAFIIRADSLSIVRPVAVHESLLKLAEQMAQRPNLKAWRAP